MAEGGFSEPIRILLTVLRAWLKTLSEYQGAVLAPRAVAWWRRTGMRGASYPQSRTYQRQCLALVVLREVMNHWTEVAGGVAIARTCEGRECMSGTCRGAGEDVDRVSPQSPSRERNTCRIGPRLRDWKAEPTCPRYQGPVPVRCRRLPVPHTFHARHFTAHKSINY